MEICLSNYKHSTVLKRNFKRGMKQGGTASQTKIEHILCFVKFYSNCIDSNLFRGSNLRQNPCLGGEFCILTKIFLGYISKPLFTHVYTCISESPPPPRLVTSVLGSVRSHHGNSIVLRLAMCVHIMVCLGLVLLKLSQQFICST